MKLRREGLNPLQSEAVIPTGSGKTARIEQAAS